MMDLRLLNASVVVLSEGNNPKLLNHDFLAKNTIVPADWEIWDIIVTPPFSQLTYKNDVQFTVEINKLQVQVHSPETIDWKCDLPEMATGYLKLLPHVSYKGVGINFAFQVVGPPAQYYADFLQEGPWWHKMGGLSGATLVFHYNNHDPLLNVKIETLRGKRAESNNDLELVLSANYHRDFSPDQELDRIAYIHQLPVLADQFTEFAQLLPLG